jgi:hypothetical protein
VAQVGGVVLESLHVAPRSPRSPLPAMIGPEHQASTPTEPLGQACVPTDMLGTAVRHGDDEPNGSLGGPLLDVQLGTVGCGNATFGVLHHGRIRAHLGLGEPPMESVRTARGPIR